MRKAGSTIVVPPLAQPGLRGSTGNAHAATRLMWLDVERRNEEEEEGASATPLRGDSAPYNERNQAEEFTHEN